MIFNLLSECLPYPFHPKGEPRFMVSYPLCFVLKSVSFFSLSNACFLQINSLRTTHNVPN